MKILVTKVAQKYRLLCAASVGVLEAVGMKRLLSLVEVGPQKDDGCLVPPFSTGFAAGAYGGVDVFRSSFSTAFIFTKAACKSRPPSEA